MEISPSFPFINKVGIVLAKGKRNGEEKGQKESKQHLLVQIEQ